MGLDTYDVPCLMMCKDAERRGLTLEKIEQMVNDYDPMFRKAQVNIEHAYEGDSLGQISKFFWQFIMNKKGEVQKWVVASIDKDGFDKDLLSKIYEKKVNTVSVEYFLDYPEEGKNYLSGLAFMGLNQPQIPGQTGLDDLRKAFFSMNNIKENQLSYYDSDLNEEASKMLYDNVLSQMHLDFNNKGGQDGMADEKTIQELNELKTKFSKMEAEKLALQKEVEENKKNQLKLQDLEKEKLSLEEKLTQESKEKVSVEEKLKAEAAANAANTEEIKKINLALDRAKKEQVLSEHIAKLKTEHLLNSAELNAKGFKEHLMTLSLDATITTEVDGKETKISPFEMQLKAIKLSVPLPSESAGQPKSSLSMAGVELKKGEIIDTARLSMHAKAMDLLNKEGKVNPTNEEYMNALQRVEQG